MLLKPCPALGTVGEFFTGFIAAVAATAFSITALEGEGGRIQRGDLAFGDLAAQLRVQLAGRSTASHGSVIPAVPTEEWDEKQREAGADHDNPKMAELSTQRAENRLIQRELFLFVLNSHDKKHTDTRLSTLLRVSKNCSGGKKNLQVMFLLKIETFPLIFGQIVLE
jgi:hypothetical protein